MLDPQRSVVDVFGDVVVEDGDRVTETMGLAVSLESASRETDESVVIQERSFDMEVSADDAADFDPQGNDAAREEVEGQVATEKVAGVQPRPHEDGALEGRFRKSWAGVNPFDGDG